MAGRRAGWCGLGGFDAREHGARAAGALDQNGEPDGGEHEDDSRPGGHLGQQVGRPAGSERGLRALTAKGAGEISALALLQQNNANQDEANDNVNGTDKPDHGETETSILIGAEGGT